MVQLLWVMMVVVVVLLLLEGLFLELRKEEGRRHGLSGARCGRVCCAQAPGITLYSAAYLKSLFWLVCSRSAVECED